MFAVSISQKREKPYKLNEQQAKKTRDFLKKLVAEHPVKNVEKSQEIKNTIDKYFRK
jgi:hypothetical protein